MKEIIPGVDIVTTGEAQELTNKTLIAPVIQGTINAGSGLVLPAFRDASAVTFSGTVTHTGSLISSYNCNVTGNFNTTGTSRLSGPTFFSSNCNVTGNFNSTAKCSMTGNIYTALPSADPHIAGELYYTATANAVFMSRG